MNKEAFDAAVRREEMKREQGSVGVSTYQRNNDMRDFSDAEGDANGKHLASKEKKAKSNDRMTEIPGINRPGNDSRDT